ncbi:hypothetical protein BJP36_35645 [Moorena producens JHB]|uniref:Uncharacterized protein n=1 Tax=Moorena producens (strain JHB) TaxID=1454205 RepID=A0A9Q9STL2_MOOP1|nr:hypothetical protein [Moorena producens]WAN69427.1 hypothetical protein BJP36_35645 [Moorena producens JHB]
MGEWGELTKSYPGKISGTGKMPIPQVRPKGDLLAHWKAHLLLKSFHD